MDPDANLAEQLALADKILNNDASDGVGDGKVLTQGERLAELAEAMSEWLAKGGALPKAWQR